MKKSRIPLLIAILIVLVFALAGCASQNPMQDTANESGKIHGFWTGLWDGLIAIPAFIINLLSGKGGAFYNVHNNGGWYNFGFLLGFGAFSGGGGSAIVSLPSHKGKSKAYFFGINKHKIDEDEPS